MKKIKKLKKKNGFSLIELLLVLGIIAALAITAFMIYPKVSASNNAQTEATNINTIKASVTSLYSSSPDYTGLDTEVGIKSKILEYRNRHKSLRIGYMSNVNNCKFGIYNTVYSYVSLNQIELGDFTYISDYTSISRTTIGKFCSIGPDCKIGLGKHPTKDFVSTHPVFFSSL